MKPKALLRISSFIGCSIFQAFSVIFLLAYLLGVLNIYFSDKKDYCLMTYMFEYPQFVKISVPGGNEYPQYALYAYSEGRATERTRKMWFDGVPVLFLPGNSGSHMQVRSLASVALRKALADGYDNHFDYFSVSYNEELSGLYGGTLQRQTEYAAVCISAILQLYKSNKYTKTVPTSVILIGHSMGGVITKRLLAYPPTLNTTALAISLAAPLDSPIINADVKINNYYLAMDAEWDDYIRNVNDTKKVLLSFGGGPRDVLIPSGLIYSSDSYINALTTSIPGVWLSCNHVSIVWCKQLVLTINKYLFSILDYGTEQLSEDVQVIMRRARQHFQANHSMILSTDTKRRNVSMTVDAFWYEDNRRIYQISRPEIDRTTYLMIRLVPFPQNRFVAIQTVDVDDKDWVFGCNAKDIHSTYRYCKQATSLTELTRWSGSAQDFGKRKLATVHLHSILEEHHDWTHIIVKVSPTRKPIVLNVDVNDYASRQLKIDLSIGNFFRNVILKEETEVNSLYYEVVLNGFNYWHQAYLLYVEPTANCKANNYHVSAEVHVPWAENHEYFHYFTPLKHSPMKLRLYKSNPNITLGLDPVEPVKVILLLDPQCTFTISISRSWYHSLAQFARHYTPLLIPYVSAIILLATRSNLNNLKEKGSCISVHGALMSEGVKPYYALVFSRLGATFMLSVPIITFIFENANWKNMELQYFIKSLMVLPTYMVALGILNVAATAILGIMVFSSQLAHRMLFRIILRGWGSGGGFAERAAGLLQRAPMVVSAALVCAASLSCGAASLAAGAAFYTFMISKMYEEYLEDYCYKLMAKIASKMCSIFYKKKQSNPVVGKNETEVKSIDNNDVSQKLEVSQKVNEPEAQTSPEYNDRKESNERDIKKTDTVKEVDHVHDIDDDLNNLNFHMMLYFLWMTVTLLNVPALLMWARNFKYSMVLKPDTSYYIGLIMSICSTYIWQIEGPRKNLRHYDMVSSLIFTMAIFILTLGPFSLIIVNYGITLIFVVITLQQLLDVEELEDVISKESLKPEHDTSEESKNAETDGKTKTGNKPEFKTKDNPTATNNEDSNEDCDVCSESRIYNVFKTLKDKFSLKGET